MTQQPCTVIGLGELLWDVFPDGKRPGGAPANVAYQAQQLGCRGVVCSRVGSDESGEELLTFLQQKGLPTQTIQRDPIHATGRVTVSFNERQQPEYVIHEDVAWDYLEFTDQLQATMQQADAVCFGTLAQRSPTSRNTILQAVESTSNECLRVYDVNIRQHYYEAEWIERSLRLASVLKLNDEEVDLLAGVLGLPLNPPDFAKQLIARFGVQLVCVTRGAKGCLLVTDREITIDIPGRPVAVADTVGAGDAFTAGLIYARLARWSTEQSGEFANRVGGIVASHHGAMPAAKAELAKLVESFTSQEHNP